MRRAPTLPTSCGSLPPEGALRLRPGEAGSAAPAGEEGAPTLGAALRLRPGEAEYAAVAGEDRASMPVASRAELLAAFDQLLQPERFKDYGPNGLQVEGKPEIRKIISGVTASLALI